MAELMSTSCACSAWAAAFVAWQQVLSSAAGGCCTQVPHTVHGSQQPTC